MKQIFAIAIMVLSVWLGIVFVRPYWDRHLLQLDIEEAAIYGTKKSEGEVRRFLVNKMRKKGRDITGDNLLVVKNDRNTVYVKVSYSDEVKIAGRTLKKLRFTLEAEEKEVKNGF
ncbi:MAG: hypothetical protein CVU64_14430 [Deltaproteobacteria bacterium HGW-Deltaproteobacteria-21]|nr:MAG: hypothetical protein CVU64_14430 [Deltaproteobacteria bacterium HGW-Deltaproteobacteria-21]